MLPLLRLRTRRPDRPLQSLTLLETLWHGHPVHGPGSFVLVPGRSRDVAADYGLDGQDRKAMDEHAAVFQERMHAGRDGGREGERDEVDPEVWDMGGDQGEPVGGELG